MHLLVLGGLSVGASLLGWFLISVQRGGGAIEYLLLLGLYGVASAAFIFSRVGDNRLRFFDIPVFLTILMFVEFGLAPLEYFIKPSPLDRMIGNDAPLLRALLYVLAGVAAFWAGCTVKLPNWSWWRDGRLSAGQPVTAHANMRVFQLSVGLYAIAFAARLYMLTHGLYSYVASATQFFSNLPLVGVLNFASGFGAYALVIACIEKFLRPPDRKWKLLFIAIFTSECFWGLISGMKAFFLQNFVIVAVVASLTQRRFRKGWVIAAVAGLVAFYPVSNAYRALVRAGGEQVGSLAAGEEVAAQAVTMTSRVRSNLLAELETGWRDSVERVDMLQSMGLVLTLGPEAPKILGRARLWMLPFYPFIPRFLWHSKPRLFEGERFAAALGFGDSWRTAGFALAPTYTGDLYVRGGLAGILAGMFLLGIVAQWLASGIGGAVERQRLFVYASIFLTVTDLEYDAFSAWANAIRAFVVLSAVAWLVYGPRRTGRKGLRATALADVPFPHSGRLHSPIQRVR